VESKFKYDLDSKVSSNKKIQEDMKENVYN
jgi:hypothetical protein